MLIEIILLILIGFVIVLLGKFNFKRCNTIEEKIVFVLYMLTYCIPMVIFYFDYRDIPSKLNMNQTINLQNWLGFLANYSANIVSAIIGAVISIFIVFYQIRKNNEDNEKRDKENLRLQNMPLLKYDCKKEDDRELEIIELRTKLKDGVRQQINLNIKNIGLNTVRKSYIQIKSDILEENYSFKIGNQSSLEKNESIVMQFLLKLMVDTKYKFEIKVLYQDLLFNWYQQNVTLEYELSPINVGGKCLCDYQL